MQIHISPRHLSLTSAIHSYVADKIGHLEEITDHIIAAHVVLFHDEKRNPKQAYVVKVHLAVPGPDVHGEDCDADLYAAIDKSAAKIARQLRKRKTKLKDKRKATYQKARERQRRG
jgi:putative sigma-54 modulation protein